MSESPCNNEYIDAQDLLKSLVAQAFSFIAPVKVDKRETWTLEAGKVQLKEYWKNKDLEQDPGMTQVTQDQISDKAQDNLETQLEHLAWRLKQLARMITKCWDTQSNATPIILRASEDWTQMMIEWDIDRTKPSRVQTIIHPRDRQRLGALIFRLNCEIIGMERAQFIEFETYKWDPNVEWWHWWINKEMVFAEVETHPSDLATWLKQPNSFTPVHFKEETGPYQALVEKLREIQMQFNQLWHSKPRQSKVNVSVDLEHGRIDFVQDTNIIMDNEMTWGISAMNEMKQVIFEAADAVFKMESNQVSLPKRKLTHIAGFHWYPSAWVIKIRDDGKRTIWNSVREKLETDARVKDSFKARVLKQIGLSSRQPQVRFKNLVEEFDPPYEHGTRVFSVSLLDDSETGNEQYGKLEWLTNKDGRPEDIPVPDNIPENWSLKWEDPETAESNVQQGPTHEIRHPDDTEIIWGTDGPDGWTEVVHGMSSEEYEVLHECKARLLKMGITIHEIWDSEPRARPISVKSTRDGTLISVQWGKSWRKPYLGEEIEMRYELQEAMEYARQAAFEGMSSQVLEREYCAWSAGDEFWNWKLRGYAKPKDISFAESETRERVLVSTVDLQERRIQARLLLKQSGYHSDKMDDNEPKIAEDIQSRMDALAAAI
ncbi:hypothetical protein C8J56DRAFT_1049029 [Mycena floridula]|nr:hypothetical protein C8J56DRAFT_1049029 [Mycena floridula]